MLGYVWLLGWAVWIEGARDIRVPRYHELIFLTALALSGIIQGQVIRRVKSMAAEYARRLAARPRRPKSLRLPVPSERPHEPTEHQAEARADVLGLRRGERPWRFGMLAVPAPGLVF